MFDFDKDLQPRSMPVKYKSVQYTLDEAGESAAVEWRNGNMAASTYVDGKYAGMRNLAGVEPQLVSRCLRITETNAAVPLGVICNWPARLVNQLYQWVLDNSDMNEKNEPLLRDGKSALEEALLREECPIGLVEFRTYLRTLTDPRFKELNDMLSDEDLIKNVPGDTTTTTTLPPS